MQMGCDILINPGTHRVKLLINFSVCKSHHEESEAFQIGCPIPIMNYAIRRMMLCTVQFNHQFGAAAIKIRNIPSELLLPSKLHSVTFQI